LIDHLSIGVRSLETSTRFYEAVLGAIGYSKMVERPASVGFGTKYPEFWINARPLMAPVDAQAGSHVCLRARSPAEVEEFHRRALANGGADGGPPGTRHYTKGAVFATFIVDPDGNRVEAMAILPSVENTGNRAARRVANDPSEC
jgi:catechol 2,3-dioxygenase-like lactoylglutathione lyase family enzyme